MSAFGMAPNFNEPQTDDTTSVQQTQVPQQVQVQPEQNPLARVLGKKQKKGNQKNPAALASAIYRAKKARQSGQKWG